MKTSTLTGADLNRAVAMALGLKVWSIDNTAHIYQTSQPTHRWVLSSTDCKPSWMETRAIPNYAGDIAVAWPIIKENKISIGQVRDEVWASRWEQTDHYPGYYHKQCDADPQIAAMRCFVASVYGDDINLET